MQHQDLRLHHFEPASLVNGPGKRSVIWVQGCALGCYGCFNPETHNFAAGYNLTVDSIVKQVIEQKNKIEGITISGGEPVHQHKPLACLFEKIRNETNLSILIFSGYEMSELKRIPGINRFLKSIDVLIAGRYDHNRRVANGLVGSSNKTIYFLSERYTLKDLEQVPQSEVLITENGEVKISGIDPLKWNSK